LVQWVAHLTPESGDWGTILIVAKQDMGGWGTPQGYYRRMDRAGMGQWTPQEGHRGMDKARKGQDRP